ncbi:hypothetical protein HFN63_00280 [Rhizobium leguminosarum]|uniref:hypothetical protein n=1 Tax=Rhizobium leguminosarum TaxID=384 RepID=UPI001C971441|nr:hypothetical protein [Rhizobium leguminosarum]MBY5768569.1 hypothetical protein [Rhizobium leguminosarum]
MQGLEFPKSISLWLAASLQPSSGRFVRKSGRAVSLNAIQIISETTAVNPVTLLEMTTHRLTEIHREIEVLNYALTAATILAIAEDAAAVAAIDLDDQATLDAQRITGDTKVALEFAAQETRFVANAIAGRLAGFRQREVEWSRLMSTELGVSVRLDRRQVAV